MPDPRGTIQNVGGTIRRIPQGQGASPQRPVVQAGQPSVRPEVAATIAYANAVADSLVPVPDRPMTGISLAPLSAPRRISFMGTSFPAVRTALEKALGAFPLRIGLQFEGPVIAGMAAAAGDGSAPYDEILAALKQHGEIELRLEP